jgi:large subunit ribosomal protein L4
MANIDVVNMKNEKAGSVELAPAVFEAEVKEHLFHAEVRRQLALRRAGTHATKNRALVSGGGAKPYRQKGTGRARQGTIRAPQFAGGGVAFGPVPRSYEHKLPKKVRAAALRSALSLRQGEGAIKVVEAFDVADFKTKQVAGMLDALGIADETTLIVTAEPHPHLEASARNIPGVSVIRAEGLNVYDVLRHGQLVFAQDALAAVVGRFEKKKGAEA